MPLAWNEIRANAVCFRSERRLSRTRAGRRKGLDREAHSLNLLINDT